MDWRGWLVTDFYAAYNLIPGHHQRCWVHLLRDLHDLKQAQAANAEVLLWVTDVRQLYDAAHTWLVAHPTPTLVERRTQYDDLFAQACRLGEQYALTSDHPCCTLAKRVLRHQDELFQFVLVPGCWPTTIWPSAASGPWSSCARSAVVPAAQPVPRPA